MPFSVLEGHSPIASLFKCCLCKSWMAWCSTLCRSVSHSGVSF